VVNKNFHSASPILECAALFGCDLSQPLQQLQILKKPSGVKPPRTKALTGQRTPKIKPRLSDIKQAVTIPLLYTKNSINRKQKGFHDTWTDQDFCS
jgi:hypothetical protein